MDIENHRNTAYLARFKHESRAEPSVLIVSGATCSSGVQGISEEVSIQGEQKFQEH
jgi:hypothetical protein